jgi:hypothetical protein
MNAYTPTYTFIRPHIATGREIERLRQPHRHNRWSVLLAQRCILHLQAQRCADKESLLRLRIFSYYFYLLHFPFKVKIKCRINSHAAKVTHKQVDQVTESTRYASFISPKRVNKWGSDEKKRKYDIKDDSLLKNQSNIQVHDS